MASLSATPTEAQTPETPEGMAHSTPLDNSHARVEALPDHAFYDIQHHRPASEVTPEFYLTKLNVSFTKVNGNYQYRWVTTPHHFLLQEGQRWIYKRNKNVVNARNTMLELNEVGYSVEQWLVKDFGSFNYVEARTPL